MSSILLELGVISRGKIRALDYSTKYLNLSSCYFRKFELSQRPQRVIQKDVKNIQLSAFFDLKEDGNLDILYEYAGTNGPMVNFIKCDDKGDTTFLKVQIFTGPECSSGECCNMDVDASKRVKIGKFMLEFIENHFFRLREWCCLDGRLCQDKNGRFRSRHYTSRTGNANIHPMSNSTNFPSYYAQSICAIRTQSIAQFCGRTPFWSTAAAFLWPKPTCLYPTNCAKRTGYCHPTGIG